MSFQAKADQIPVPVVIDLKNEEISPVEAPPEEKFVVKRDSEPRVFHFDDASGEVSVFDEIAMNQVRFEFPYIFLVSVNLTSLLFMWFFFSLGCSRTNTE